MKNYLILLVAFVSFVGHSQISFGAKHRGKPADLKKETLERFKSTTTVFVLSDVIDASEYEQILKDTWTVTPYKLISHEDFNLMEMHKGNYSFAALTGFKVVKKEMGMTKSASLHTYFDVAMYDADEIGKKLAKLSPDLSDKKKKKKLKAIFNENRESILKFYLFPTAEFVGIALTKKDDEIVKSIYTEDVFFNYTKGMLRNYLQKSNALIAGEKTYWMYKKDAEAEKIARLASSKLFIPEYITQKTNAWTAGISDRDEKEVEKLLKGYGYDYELINKDDLDNAIISGKEFYYMRYVRMNAERFVQIVNAKTGDVVFRDYITGLGYNLKAKNLEHLSKVIAKSKKNLAK
ncbi:hypothetical protein FEE95_21095 [Maribacter algarum]|uniref:Uncharacterized protein n=1 Tax=Maribacter algarum (ex Zhang et al. 2020) TaxID=2578118 RepID=A0A5S3PE80_9FLAO|nr:hypothetical protein [Maribacter algarum]TMM52187.1 hypothetical protein FEE95_21095 [Maribacter algarum]